MGRAASITKALRSYDRQLLCERNEHGVLCVYRKSATYDCFDFKGTKLLVTRPFRHFIMALTDNWSFNGTPVDWGIEPIKQKIKASDLWQNPRMAEELMVEHEKGKEAERRDFSNNVESFLRDYRRQFAKTFNDVNTSTLEKIDKRRIDDGYRK